MKVGEAAAPPTPPEGFFDSLFAFSLFIFSFFCKNADFIEIFHDAGARFRYKRTPIL